MDFLEIPQPKDRNGILLDNAIPPFLNRAEEKPSESGALQGPEAWVAQWISTSVDAVVQTSHQTCARIAVVGAEIGGS